MSQNQSYFWQATRRNVFIRRTARLQMLLALLAVLTFATICRAEIEPPFNSNNDGPLGAPTNFADDEKQLMKNIAYNAGHELPNSDAAPKEAKKGGGGFIDAFTASISVILFTELGDKTFFIAAIMAMRHPRLIVFGGAITALALMTVLSMVFGMAATIIPKVYTYYISTALFAIFGLKMIYEGYFMKATDAQDELEEVQSDLRKREDEMERSASAALMDPESGLTRRNSKKSASYLTTRVLMQAFTMTFLAEWGDRSQLTTIILAASKDAYGVTAGGVLGHSICTGLAVIGGRMVAAKISVRTVTIVGGIVFLGFALYALLVKPDDI